MTMVLDFTTFTRLLMYPTP